MWLEKWFFSSTKACSTNGQQPFVKHVGTDIQQQQRTRQGIWFWSQDVAVISTICKLLRTNHETWLAGKMFHFRSKVTFIQVNAFINGAFIICNVSNVYVCIDGFPHQYSWRLPIDLKKTERSVADHLESNLWVLGWSHLLILLLPLM